jgi:hypothetical protein
MSVLRLHNDRAFDAGMEYARRADPPPDVIRRIESEFAARMVEDAIAAVIRTEKYEYHYSPGKEWGWCKADLQTGKYVEKSTGPDPRWYSTLTEAMEAELGREG